MENLKEKGGGVSKVGVNVVGLYPLNFQGFLEWTVELGYYSAYIGTQPTHWGNDAYESVSRKKCLLDRFDILR